MNRVISYRSSLWQAERLVLVASIAVSAGPVTLAQQPRLGPQPDGSRIVRCPDGKSRYLFAISPDTLNTGLCPVEALVFRLRFDYTGIGQDYHVGEILRCVDGRMTVPAGRLLIGDIPPPPYAAGYFSWLSQLSPDGLYALRASPYRPPGRPIPVPGDAVVPYLTRFTGLKCLDIGSTDITAKGLRHLVKIKGLERLGVPFRTTDEGLAELTRLPNLKALGNLVGFDQVDPSFTDRGLEIVAGIPTLEELDVCSTRITDAGLAHLTRLPRLRYLRIWGPRSKDSGEVRTKITDAGMAHVARISSLKTLNISYLNITDAGLAHLAKLPNLEGLDLFNTLVTDEGMAHLRSLRTLKTLNFGGGDLQENRVRISDRGVVYLSEIRSLERLTGRHSDEVLPYLCTLPNIRSLGAGSDADLARISKVQSLEFVSVSGDFSACSLAYLTRLKSLQKLSLGLSNESQVGECLAQVARLTSLKTLGIYGAGARVMMSDLKQLNPLSNLVYLHVYPNIQQDGSGLDLSGLTSLEYLNLHVGPGSSKFTDRDLATISKLPNLRELEMAGSDFTDEAKARVARLPKLKSWSGVDLNAIRTGQPERRPAAAKSGANKTSGRPAQREKPR